MGQEYDYSPEDVWTMFQSYAFDVSVGEIWVALAFGGRLVVLDYLTTRTPDRFVEVLAEISEKTTPAKTGADLLRVYERWVATGSERAEKALREAGILPMPGKKRKDSP